MESEIIDSEGIEVAVLNNSNEIKNYENKIQAKKNSYMGNSYTRFNYYCSTNSQTNCHAKLKVLSNHNDTLFRLYRKGKHNQNCIRDVSEKIICSDEIMKIFNQGVTKPMLIRRKLLDVNIYVKSEYISQVIYKFKKKI